jgi:hypothetical protein
VADPSDSANVKIPFVIDNGQVVIDTALIKNGTITNAKIANLAVDSAKLASAAVTNAKIANAAITNAKIDNAAITEAKIYNAAVTNAKIADAAISNAKIANAAITYAKIGDAEVDTLKIAGEAVTKPTAVDGAFSLSYITHGFYRDSQDFNIATTGYPVLLDFYAYSPSYTSSYEKGSTSTFNIGFTVSLYQDGVLITEFTTVSRSRSAYKEFFQPAAGAHTFTIEVEARSGATAQVRLVFLEVKR